MISIVDATKEVKDALIKLGYGVYGHNVGVHRVMVDLFKVYLSVKITKALPF